MLLTVSEFCYCRLVKLQLNPVLWNTQQERCSFRDVRYLLIRIKLGEHRLCLEEEKEVGIQLGYCE
jgi:hypothetical protein